MILNNLRLVTVTSVDGRLTCVGKLEDEGEGERMMCALFCLFFAIAFILFCISLISMTFT
jgi:hypothetical protein